MNRRNLIIALGGITGGGAFTLGTGAFSSAQLRRDADIAVVNDSSALIGLIPNPAVSGVNDDGGELTIDLDDPGINQNSIYQFGFFASDDGVEVDGDFPFTEPEPSKRKDGEFGSAFLIANQTSNQQKLEIDYELGQTDDENDGEFETSYWFEVHHNHKDVDRTLINKPVEDGNAKVTLGSGEACGVSFLLEVPGDTLGEEITGSLSITAGEAVSDDEQSSDNNQAPK